MGKGAAFDPEIDWERSTSLVRHRFKSSLRTGSSRSPRSACDAIRGVYDLVTEGEYPSRPVVNTSRFGAGVASPRKSGGETFSNVNDVVVC